MRYSALLLVILVACSEAREDFEVGDKRLVGKWEWLKTEDFQPEKYYERFLTPQLTGQTQQLEFRESGSFTNTINGEKVSEGFFEVYGENKLRLTSTPEIMTFNYEIQSANLTLEALADSGVVITYIKTKQKD